MSKLLTIKEVAKKLGVSRSTVSLLLREGKLKGMLITERNWRIFLEDLEDYINEHFNVNERFNLGEGEGEKEDKSKPSVWGMITPGIYFVPAVLAFLMGVLIGVILK